MLWAPVYAKERKHGQRPFQGDTTPQKNESIHNVRSKTPDFWILTFSCISMAVSEVWGEAVATAPLGLSHRGSCSAPAPFSSPSTFYNYLNKNKTNAKLNYLEKKKTIANQTKEKAGGGGGGKGKTKEKTKEKEKEKEKGT
jgi:hypothetical protein